jgi:membrane protein DedA with SNARE-associated domain/pimeloyl-ACP methyl ester carboxylesterase
MTPAGERPRRRRIVLRGLLLLYLVLLLVSHTLRPLSPPPVSPAPGESLMRLPARDGASVSGSEIDLVYLDRSPEGSFGLPVVLLHGSPGSKHDFRGVTPVLAGSRRVLAPDLPGFGDSTRKVPDYSIATHARYVADLLERLDVEAYHLVGFSMGGGVALRLYDLAPDRVGSLTLLSAIGVQELELLGDYHLNRAIHGLQLGGLWLIDHAVPHMGWLDDAFLWLPYARNFYDTDQRPLRGILQRFEPPMLILHGERDVLVPPPAAREHARIVPQAELDMVDDDHFMVFRGPRPQGAPGMDARRIGERIEEFLRRAESGEAPTRDRAAPERVQAAAVPFDPSTIPAATGFSLLVVLLLIALGTLVSEDLSCVTAGLLVANGRLEFLPAAAACALGIYVGDLLLYLAGRWIGRPALRRAPLRWMISPERVEISSRWFRRRGPVVILLSRFLPGTRLATYFGAGMLHTRFLWFSFYFLIAVLLWTPLLVGLSALAGQGVLEWLRFAEGRLPWVLLLTALAILLTVKLVLPLATFRGRRLLLGAWRRWTRWEFWPPWLFYPPVVARVLWLGLRHRSPLLFTAANPGIEAGGFIAESKAGILHLLRHAGDLVARHRLLPGTSSTERRMGALADFIGAADLRYPLVLKPDLGQRGAGVAIVHDADEARAYLERASYDVIAQEYAPGEEFGIFWYRLPGERHGRIFSVTEKRIPVVTGDGKTTLDRLILADPRAVAMARLYREPNAERLDSVPAAGEPVRLVELGTHCRGAIFLDGRRIVTPGLQATLDRIGAGTDGFWFGRYDVRAPSLAELMQGRGFKIVELNGVTSEATHIYDPRVGLLEAYRVLFEQWGIAFEIGRRNAARGVRPVGLRELARLLRTYQTVSSEYPG